MSNELDLLKQLNLVSIDNEKPNNNEDAFDPLKLKNDFLNRLNNTSDKEELENILKDVQSSKLDAYNKKDIIGKLLDKIKKDINNKNTNDQNKLLVKNQENNKKDNKESKETGNNNSKEDNIKDENNISNNSDKHKKNIDTNKKTDKDNSDKIKDVNIDYIQIKNDIMRDMNINSLKEKSKKLEATKKYFSEDEFSDIQNMLNNKIINMENILKRNKAIQKERLEKERLEKERLEKERLEEERLEEERLEEERLEEERLEKERLEEERLEEERLEEESNSKNNSVDSNKEILKAKLKQGNVKKREELGEDMETDSKSNNIADTHEDDHDVKSLQMDNEESTSLNNTNTYVDKRKALKEKIKTPKGKSEVKSSDIKDTSNKDLEENEKSGMNRLDFILNKVEEQEYSDEDVASELSENKDDKDLSINSDIKDLNTEKEDSNHQTIKSSLLSNRDDTSNDDNTNIDIKKDKLKGMEILTNKTDAKEVKAAHIIEREKERENKLKREAELRVKRKLQNQKNESENVFSRITKSANRTESNLPEVSNEPVILAGRKKPIGQYKQNKKNTKVSEDDVLERDLSVIEFNYDESDADYDGYYEDVLPIDHDVDQSKATLVKLIALTVGIVSFLGFLIFLFMKYIVLN